MDEYEQAYGKKVTIYITKADQGQLKDDGSRKWYDPIPYTTEPSAFRCIRTQVGEHALQDGIFYPDRYEPELAAECCEEVKSKVPKAPNKRRFRKGDRVRQTLHGPGTIVTDGYDAGTVLSVSKGRVRVRWDKSEDRHGPNVYDPKTGWEAEALFPEMRTRIHLLDK